MFNYKKKPIVVVEIGNDWLKVLEDAPSPMGRYIAKAQFQKLAQIKESVATAIADIFRTLALNKASVIICIPRHLVTVRTLEVPSMDPKEISEIVDLQINKQTPYSKEEIVATYKILDSPRQGYTSVMLVIATCSVVNERILTLQKVGVEAQKVAVSSEGVFNWFNAAYMPSVKLEPDQAIIVIDIDSNYSDFIVIRREKLIFTRNIFIGANQLSEAYEQWQLKFIEELKRSIERYSSEQRDVKISKIFLSGAARNFKELDRHLSMELDMPCEVTHPAKGINLGKDLDILHKDDFKYVSTSPVFGIAIKHKELSFDLIPSGMRIQKLMERKRKDLTVMGILFAAIVTMSSLLMLINVYNKNSYMEQIKQKIALVEKESNEIEKMRVSINLIENRLEAKGTSIDILNEVYRITSKEIYFTSITIEEKKQVTLKGRAFAMSDVFKFVTTVENSPYFENVKTTHTTTKKEQDIEYAVFEIICTYQKG